MNSTEPHAAYPGTYDGCDACDASNPYSTMTQAYARGCLKQALKLFKTKSAVRRHRIHKMRCAINSDAFMTGDALMRAPTALPKTSRCYYLHLPRHTDLTT